MQQRGVLLLADPLRRNSRFSQMHIENLQTLIFDGNGRFFSQAQLAFQRARRRWEWVCVAAEGSAAWIALALAAQLSVDRLALRLEEGTERRLRELRRIEAFARRNLSLVTGEILLIDAPEAAARRLARGLGRGCVLGLADARELTVEMLTAPWGGINFYGSVE